jgi:hypothetical protein
MANSSQYGAFVPSNWIWDIQQLQDIKDVSPELKELLIRLYQNLNLMANVLNVKETGQYALMEIVDGNLWFPNPANNSSTAAGPAERQELKKTFLINGALPNIGVVTIPHGITVTANTTWTYIEGTATNPGVGGVSLNSSSATISTTTTNIVITTTVDLSAYTLTYIVLRYLQS